VIVPNIPSRAARARLAARSVGVLAAVLIAAIAHADTVRVTADRALIWNSPGGVSVVLTQVAKGTSLQMRRRVGDWFEVVLPAGSARDMRDVGYIRASQVVVEPGDAPQSGGTARPAAPGAAPQGPGGGRPEAAGAVERPAPAEEPTSSSARMFVNIDAAYRKGASALKRSVPAFGDVYAEPGQLATDYGRGTGLQLDLMGGRSLWGPIGVGVGFAYYRHQSSARVDARVPHPFFFNQLRDATFTTKVLKREEIAVHVPALWMPEMGGPVKILVFGGPSFFRVAQDAVIDVSLAETYPYDVAAIGGVTTATKNGTTIGFHAGADVGYMFARTAGVGAGVRYAQARVKFRNDTSATIEGDVAGLQFVVGLRYRF
jgi:opacity protein-like surface antigen